MSWEMVRLKDISRQITDGKHGDCCNENNSGWYFISCKDIHDGIIDYSRARQITSSDALEVRKRIALEPGDSVITNSGTIGRVAFADNSPKTTKTAFQKSVAVIKPDCSKVDSLYLYYLLVANAHDMAINSNGSAQKNLLLSTIRNFKVLLPGSLEKQRRIADILSAYDKLIENSRRRIALLEEAAQRLYKEWFVDLRFPGYETTPIINGLPEGWRKGKLGDIVEFRRGKTITQNETLDGNVPVVAGGLKPAYYHARANTASPVITVSGSGANAGFCRLYSTEIWASDCSFADSSMTDSLFFAYASIKVLSNGFKQCQRGSAQPHVYPKHVNALDVVIPDGACLSVFNNAAKALYSQIGILDEQVSAAREARDRLLPKLMSGEIEVG